LICIIAHNDLGDLFVGNSMSAADPIARHIKYVEPNAIRRIQRSVLLVSEHVGRKDTLMVATIIIFIVVVCIAWVVWTEQKSKQALDKDALDQAWREVLDDPHYVERRHFEERKRVEDQARAAAANR